MNAALKKRDQYETVHKPRRWLAMKKGPIDAAPVVLGVDDEPLIRIFTVQVLADAGYEVDEAGNSDEALQRLNGRLIKALVTDIDMPGRLDGCGLAWEVHSLCPSAAVIVISGVATPGPHELPPKARFLRKPTDPEDLLAELHDAIVQG
jgi:CheY-like chemotaxis protein